MVKFVYHENPMDHYTSNLLMELIIIHVNTENLLLPTITWHTLETKSIFVVIAILISWISID